MIGDPRHEYNNPWDDVQTFGHSVFLRGEVITIGRGSRIDSFCKLEGGSGLRMGTYVHVASFCHLNIGGGELEIGDHCFFASGSRVVTGGNKPEGMSMSACSPKEMQVLQPGRVVFHNYSGCGSGAIILPGVTLHEGAVAGAGSLITRDIPAWEIWAGNPAKFLRKRLVKPSTISVDMLPIDEDMAQRDADLRATARGSLLRRA